MRSEFTHIFQQMSVRWGEESRDQKEKNMKKQNQAGSGTRILLRDVRVRLHLMCKMTQVPTD